MKPNISSKVYTIVNSHIETNGAGWLLSLGYGPCNDYADTVAQQVTRETGYYIRFETVARNIRIIKARLKANQVQSF